MAYRIPEETARCDVLIIGSGIAGLMLCHLLSDTGLKVLLACKGKLIDSNTAFAQGGLAAVVADSKANFADHPELHLQDTINSGAGLTDSQVARIIVEHGGELVKRLAQFGVRFDKQNGKYEMALEGGHSRPRVLHAKDASGKAISTGLIQSLTSSPNVTIWEHAYTSELLLAGGRCIGARFLTPAPAAVFSRHTVLATGGLGRVFSRTTNPELATGDGIAMAYRAGARLADMEFVQFHPTALCKPGAPAALISEAVRGAGAWLLDDRGERFAFRFDDRGELATRDVVARAIYSTMIERGLGCVYLDMRPIGKEKLEDHFPNILAAAKHWGIDALHEPVPIAPAAHYFMGGILADAMGRTSIANLYAIGECACTGLHGANRLASNSLLEGGVMAILLSKLLQGQQSPVQVAVAEGYNRSLGAAPHAVPGDLPAFREQMFHNVGLERDGERLGLMLNNAFHNLAAPESGDQKAVEAANITLLGWLIARCAYERRESRGAHFRCDFPERHDGKYRKRLVIDKQGSFWMDVSGKPTARAGQANYVETKSSNG